MSAAATVSELIRTSATRLEQAGVAFGHGTTNAHDEAAWLVLWQLGLPLDSPLDDDAPDSVAQREVSQEHRSHVDALIDQRIATRKPAAYLTREAWLQGVAFYIDERSIVPRSFIAELLADGSIDAWLSDQTHKVLDLCTGNGSLACLAALTYPDVQVTGADISSDALAVARINVDRHGLSERVRLVQSDGMSLLEDGWDLVLCNPPYVNADSMSKLPDEYRAEPELALAGGADGMDFVRALFAVLAQKLNQDGVLVLEIGNEKPYFEAAFPTLPVFWLDTSSGDEQVLLVTRQALESLNKA
ncbi:50S ribosomal protein L3 N(5)-glutamine methyltransferase [Diaphorobacter aerolatus]|uniref:50S ribosomal protein L3 N(5)-glutamine methyltransferase n=1 Tax=Diaphorobacter aerolatus TaxID=1288495 RepID=A0A7H0GL03_9BURK|nr:50S ribosomal protein L3 N(5)-glutamine methyltransferase [Diaphorobacter aerolatus]QNP48969.1 50S ribosomal protein L3 N(5)-glutamine methyltransferase [Diaphorobacter aerolatus]